MLRNEMCLNIIVFAATIIMVSLTGFAKFGTVQGQADSTSLTPEQKAEMCDPSNPKLNFVNGTESEICGIPKTPTSATSAESTTTGTDTEAETPSILPTPSDEG